VGGELSPSPLSLCLSISLSLYLSISTSHTPSLSHHHTSLSPTHTLSLLGFTDTADIPLLPLALVQYVHCPCPYIIGVNVRDRADIDIPEEVCGERERTLGGVERKKIEEKKYTFRLLSWTWITTLFLCLRRLLHLFQINIRRN
jgi:DENN (AEX-3) domain